PHRVARQLVDENDSLGALIAGKARTDGVEDVRFGQGGARLEHHGGGNSFAEVRMGDAEYGALGDAGYRVELGFDFLRIHVVSAGNDQVFDAADDIHVAVGIDSTEVAGFEPAVAGEFAARLRFVAPVAGEYVGAFDFEGSHCVWRRVDRSGFGVD